LNVSTGSQWLFALLAFTSATNPLITACHTWEMTQELAEAAGRTVVRVPLMKDWSADVERMCAKQSRPAAASFTSEIPTTPRHPSPFSGDL